MSLNKVIGYSIAVLHAVLIGFVLITPFVTSNLILLATVFLIDLLTVISWPIFDNKCWITILEGKFLGGEGHSWEKSSISYFNQVLGKWLPKDTINCWNTMRPYCMMFFTGCKMLPILSVM